MKLIVSFSVYGTDPVYSCGAIANAIAVRQFFPGWIARFYVDTAIPSQLADNLITLGAEVVTMNCLGGADGMFWRFLPAADPSVDAVVVRDADALLCPRNKYVVDEWLDSGKDFHIIRDHPHHRSLILGGLWGARKGLLPDIDQMIQSYLNKKGLATYGDDIDFLSRVVYPIVSGNALIHSDYVSYADETVFPIGLSRLNGQWLGFPPARGAVTQQRLEAFDRHAGQSLVRLPMPAFE